MHFLLIYEVVDNYVARRAEFRAAHLALARAAHAHGELLLGGALDEPVDQAILLFSTEEAALAFAQSDPYVQNGLVPHWRIRRWNTVALGESFTAS